jgi:nucleosome binding factor SPN SPT16 subunit
LIEPGMVFNLRISMANFDQRATRNCLLIADTVLIKYNEQESQPNYEILTNEIPKKYVDISYQFNDNDEEVPEEDK